MYRESRRGSEGLPRRAAGRLRPPSRPGRVLIAVGLAGLTLLLVAAAELDADRTLVLTLRALDQNGHVVPGVRFTYDGPASPPTTDTGTTEIRIPLRVGEASPLPGTAFGLTLPQPEARTWVLIDHNVHLPGPGEPPAEVVLIKKDIFGCLEKELSRVPFPTLLEGQSPAEHAAECGLPEDQIDAALAAFRESADNPMDRALALFLEQEYEPAVPLFELALEEAEARDAPAEVVRGATFLGLTLLKLGRYRKASEAFGRGLEVQPQDPALMGLVGLALLHSAEWDKAERYVRQALDMADGGHQFEDLLVGIQLSNLGAVLYATGRFAEAESVMRRAVSRAEVLGDQGSSDAKPLLRGILGVLRTHYGDDLSRQAVALSELAALFVDMDRFPAAGDLIRHALESDGVRLAKDYPLFSGDLNNLAVLLLNTGRFAEAERLLRNALKIDEAVYPSGHPDVAVRLSNLAQVLQDTNRLSGAKPLLCRALEILRSHCDPGDPRVATALNNLATLLLAQGRVSKAEELLREALAIDEAHYGRHHPAVATDLNNLAQALRETNQLSEAEAMMREALAIDQASYPFPHPDVSRDLNNLALLLYAGNRLEKAEGLLRRALEIDRFIYGPEHPVVAIRLGNLAKVLLSRDRAADAERQLRRALEINEASFGPHHPAVADDLNDLARLLIRENRPVNEGLPVARTVEAEVSIRRALAIDEGSSGRDHPTVARDLHTLAQVLLATGRPWEAEPPIRRALAMDKASHGSDHPKVGRDLHTLGQVLHATHRVSEAAEVLREGVRILESGLVANHPWTVSARGELQAVLGKIAGPDGR